MCHCQPAAGEARCSSKQWEHFCVGQGWNKGQPAEQSCLFCALGRFGGRLKHIESPAPEPEQTRNKGRLRTFNLVRPAPVDLPQRMTDITNRSKGESIAK